MRTAHPTLPFALCLSLFTSVTQAYSVENHDAITRRAVKLVDSCRATKTAPAIVEALVHYNLAQDALLSKPWMWHFPKVAPSAGCEGPRAACWLVLHKSFEPWTRELWRRAQSALTADQLYPALGAALHYVQDICVPAHAVPIFHPTGVTQITDAFDDYRDWAQAADQLIAREKSAFCQALNGAGSLEALLADARTETLSTLDEPVQARTDYKVDPDDKPTWSVFWAAGNGGFGRYYCEDPFGAPEVDCGWHHFHIAASTYRNYAGQRAAAAIRWSAAAIVLFERHLATCPQGRVCVPKLDDESWYPTRAQLKKLAR